MDNGPRLENKMSMWHYNPKSVGNGSGNSESNAFTTPEQVLYKLNEVYDSRERLLRTIREMKEHCQKLVNGFSNEGHEGRLKNEYLTMISYIDQNFTG